MYGSVVKVGRLPDGLVVVARWVAYGSAAVLEHVRFVATAAMCWLIDECWSGRLTRVSCGSTDATHNRVWILLSVSCGKMS